MRTTLLLLGFLIALLPACGPETLPKYSILQGLRVITLILDSPEVSLDPITGDFTPFSIQVTPVISDLYGGGRSLTYRLYHCLDPGVGLGAPPTCEGNPTRTEVSTGTVTPGGTFASPNFTGDIAPFAFNLNSITPTAKAAYVARYNSLTPDRRFNGYAILVFFELHPTGEEDKKITTFKRLLFSDPAKAIKNSNPASLDFRSNGANLSSLPPVETLIEAFVPAGSIETYTAMRTDGSSETLSEKVETAWFLTGPEDIACSRKKECTSDGTLLLSRTLPGEWNRFFPPTAALPTGRGRILIGIAKDNRGGSVLKRICDGASCP
jgi:hypothetical protein